MALTLADLRNERQRPFAGCVIQVVGTSAAFDGGGGQFGWDPNNGTDDEINTIVPGGVRGSVGPCWRRLGGATGPTGPVGPAAAVMTWVKTAADTMAATVTNEVTLGRTSVALNVDSVFFTPGAAVTADDTNYATITLYKRDSNGANQTAIATMTTKTLGSGGSGDWTAWKPVQFQAPTAQPVAAGSQLSVAIAKAGSGVVVRAGVLTVHT